MKAEHRHELKTNELAEWIANLPQWARQNIKMIIYVSVFLILVAGSYFYRRYQKNVVSVNKQINLTRIYNQLAQGKTQILQAQTRGMDISYQLIQIADDLKIRAQDIKDSQEAAFALIKRGEALRMELHYRPGTVNSDDLIAQINLAKESYNKAVEKSINNPSLMTMAKLGLGLCEEELGNFTIAENIYRDITTNPSFEGTVAAAQAKLRLEIMDDLKQEITLAPSPKAQSKATQPVVELKAPDAALTD